MKKIFTLLLAMGSLTMVFAQSSRYGNNDRHSNNQVNTYQSGHQDQHNQFSDHNQGSYNRNGNQGYNEGGGFSHGYDRMMQERRNEKRNNYFSYSRPSRNHWNERSYARRDFRNRAW
ncbi:MAG TPA: hypothetical protein VGO09_10565 [Flavisolibacter sp.]|nr:hypothetical protein [Flavisolibacter sp.]